MFKKVITLIVILITCSPLIVFSGDKLPKSKRIILIALDGISIEGYQKARHPNLDKLAEQGVLSLKTRNVMPSVTLPNWTSHLTGSGPEQHGVVGNDWTLENIKLPAIVKDNSGYYPSIFEVLKKQVPNVKTAFYYNWGPLVYPYNQNYLDEVSFLENDGYVENYRKAFDFIVENKNQPTCVFLYSVHTDHAGHKHNWMSPEYIQSIEEADVHIGEFLSWMKEKGLYKDTHFMFISDHGGVGNGHGGVSPTEMEVPWCITGPHIKKGTLLEEPNNTVNTAVTIAHLFNCQIPLPWTGEVPQSIFE